MSTFDPKKKKGFAGEDRRGDRFGNYSRRDDSRSFDHDGDPSPFVKDKRPRISRPARDVRSGSDGPFGDGGKRHSFNPNFTKDNRRRDEFPREKSYRRFDRGERSWNREDEPKERSYNRYERDDRPKGGRKPSDADSRSFSHGGRPQTAAKSWNRDNRRGKEDRYPSRDGYRDTRGDKRYGPKKQGAGHSHRDGRTSSYPRFDAPKPAGAIRLNRFIANSGICSRREADDLITAGLVAVNGQIVTELGSKVNPDDEVRFNGSVIKGEKKVYIVMNKPKGFVTSLDDPHADKTVMDLLKGAVAERVYPVGRLDKDTEGLLLITNDGALSHRLLSPKSHVSKVYEAVIDGKVTEEDRQAFAEGLDIGDDKPTLPAELTILETTEKEPGIFESRIRITICEGRFHQIKRMFEKVGKTVVYLKRLSMGSLELDPALPKGSARLLTQKEKAALGIADAETQKGK